MLKIHNNKPPNLLTDAGLNMFVDVIKLRELPLPVVDVAIKKLIWHFNMPVWNRDGTDDWNLTPQEVINRSSYSLIHQKRVTEADIKFPIIVTKYNSKLVILDGVHRLVKVFQNGDTTIKAKVIPTSYLSDKNFQT